MQAEENPMSPRLGRILALGGALALCTAFWIEAARLAGVLSS